MTGTDLQRWWRSAGPTTLALAVLMFCVAVLVDRRAGVAAAHESRHLLALGRFVSAFGLSGYMMALSLLVTGSAAVAVRRSRRAAAIRAAWAAGERALFFFAAIAASGIVCQVLKHLIGRARPRFLDTLGPFHFAGPTLRSGFEGFPSGHSTTAFAAALALSMLKPAWSPAFYAAAVAICVSRVIAEAHYPSDTVAGAALGTLVTLWVAGVFRARGIALPPRGRQEDQARAL